MARIPIPHATRRSRQTPAQWLAEWEALPQGPHTEDRAVVHVRHHARWLCVQYGATPGPPPNMSLLAMRLSHPERALSRMRTSSEALAAVERRAAAEAPERERREAVAMHREAERQQRVAMADGRDDQYMRDLHWSVFRSCLIPQEGKDSHGRE